MGTNSPELGHDEVFFELWYRVRENEQVTMTSADSNDIRDFQSVKMNHMQVSRNRFTVGMWFLSKDNIRRNIEVVLAKTENFDLCSSLTFIEGTSTPCEQGKRYGSDRADDITLFDRRSTNVPIIYFNIESMHKVFGPKQPSVNDGEFQRVLIPVNALLRNAPWQTLATIPLVNGISDINGQHLSSFYIGSEVWGKGRIWVEFERLTIFRFIAD